MALGEQSHSERAGTSPGLLELWTGFVRTKGIESVFTSTSSQGDCTKFPVGMTGISVWSKAWHDFNQRDSDIKSARNGLLYRLSFLLYYVLVTCSSLSRSASLTCSFSPVNGSDNNSSYQVLRKLNKMK